jgi:hypothetical protein
MAKFSRMPWPHCSDFADEISSGVHRGPHAGRSPEGRSFIGPASSMSSGTRRAKLAAPSGTLNPRYRRQPLAPLTGRVAFGRPTPRLRARPRRIGRGVRANLGAWPPSLPFGFWPMSLQIGSSNFLTMCPSVLPRSSSSRQSLEPPRSTGCAWRATSSGRRLTSRPIAPSFCAPTEMHGEARC